ncbi:MAG TPA: biotin/lipoyl-containing protein, partial [Solirubrobacterales bacterium]|nr:biotin/lipoyl-containing protein [Solirubrobacterales bacterium]
MADVVMPRLSDSMEEGTVLAWMKAVGDEVAVGDELVEIETDKANMVYESDVAGTLTEIVAEEGATLPIGEVIARVGEAGEAPSGGNGGAPEKAEEKEGQPKTEDEADAGTSPQKAESSLGEAPASAEASEGAAPDTATADEQGEEKTEAEAQSGDGRVKASPLARRMAKEAGLEL